MNNLITQLYPLPSQEMPLNGLYLAHELRKYSQEFGKAYVYSNFVTSLDGRIAIPHPSKSGMVVPKKITNPRDWRLFQELAVQADVLITSGRYLRDYAEGRAQEILRVYDDPKFADLQDWRIERGLSPQPDMAVISGSLNFPIPEVLTQSGRSILVFTTSQAPRERINAVEAQTGKVIIAGERSVDGELLTRQLYELGYKTVYSTTGPKVLHLLLTAGVLDRLYLTYANRILGGSPFSSINEGALLDPPVDFKLYRLYFDPHGLDGLGQMLVSYNCVNQK
jgi:riboflavin biosynthesis pyrimidine reductase